MLATFIALVDDAIRGLTFGGAVGAFAAYRARRLWGQEDPFPTITRWTGVGLVVGLGGHLLSVLS